MDQVWAHWFEVVVGIAIALVAFVFTGTCGIFLLLLVQVSRQAKNSASEFNDRLGKITEAVQGIGTQMGIVVERTLAHEKRLDRVETTK